ncbi:MAG: 30S ribosome-binding factor RbfA [Lachnospiraceae bacterium]|jgi:ribosome-binding factor A|nr:30S ribosome-binding factor RbfA [Lachnospiraceae bacterium]MCI1327889.1 30S ribosome-binding factor RbfA [Lachnospiraceae bacterium]
MRKNSIKNRKVNDAVLREISEIIRAGLKDPDIAPMTSVTEVYVAPDLKTCKVYVSVLGDGETKERTLKGLEHSKGYIRRLLAQNLNMRITPELFFRLDESIEYGNRMSKLIDEVVGKDRGNYEDGEDSGLS